MIIKFLTDLGYTKLNSIDEPDKKKPSKKQTDEKALNKPSSEKGNPIEATVPAEEAGKPDAIPFVPAPIKPAVIENEGKKEDSLEEPGESSVGTGTLSFIDTPAGWSALSVALLENIGDSKKKKINDLSEDDLILLLQGKCIQAGFDKDKENILTLIKHMLVL
jgi:hypothetical protein